MKIVIRQNRNASYYYAIVAGNGQVLAVSDTDYTRRTTARRGGHRLADAIRQSCQLGEVIAVEDQGDEVIAVQRASVPHKKLGRRPLKSHTKLRQNV